MTQEHVSEIVTFRLIPGSDAAAFTRAAADLAPFIARSGGMIRRTLSVDESGLWTDHVIWEDMAAAERAAQGISKAPEAAALMAMIAPGEVQMRHARITLQQP